ncbi:MAG: hypothetical protein A2413_17760 [Treponema sp. RIFOXYC1_FULL_61_9]|nr:MAG: hypothetical protein A2001_04360 [Treponema sp. GWC1_61_84]OHE76560.1 MAG: hypothetical protein A2413_17760 [Treponema sp. RIFOXYC1_FULL_61_9]
MDATDTMTCPRPTGKAQFSSERIAKRYQAHRAAHRWVSTDRAELFTEAWRANPDDGLALRRAKAFAHTLERLPIAIHAGELLVGGLTDRPNGAILFPETNTGGMRPTGPFDKALKGLAMSGAKVLIKVGGWVAPHARSRLSLLEFLVKRSFESFETRPVQAFRIEPLKRQKLRALIRYWRPRSARARFRELLSPSQRRRQGQFAFTAENQFVGGLFLFNADLGAVVERGLAALMEQARQGLAKADSPEKAEFHESVIVALQAVIRFAERYADLAESLARGAPEAERAELAEIARICRTVPRNPARGFREAFQSAWFAFLALVLDDGGMEVPFGRLDQILGPAYLVDKAGKGPNPGAATELIEAFFVKASEIEFLLENGVSKVEDGNTGRMTLTIGGIDDKGRDATNELSDLFLDVAGRANTLQPNVAIRIHAGTPADFLERTMRVIAGGSNSVQMFNDGVVMAGLARIGIPETDARDYIISGCVQPVPRGGYGSVCASHIVLPRTLELFLAEDSREHATYEDFLAAYKAFLSGIVAEVDGSLKAADEAHLLLPNAFVSALVPGALEGDKDVKRGGARHNLTGVSQTGLGTVVDSLHSIETLVYVTGRFSLRRLKRMTSHDFHGYEAERRAILDEVPKFGNDQREVDDKAGDLVRFLSAELDSHATFRGGRYVLGLHSEAGHVVFGMLTGATTDGRRQLEALSVGAGVAGGRDKAGYTAFLNSTLAIDFALAAGGSSVNIRVNPGLLSSEGLIQRFISLVRSYFRQGGPHLQLNVVSTETLRSAQARPAEYADLIVRISGYSARFVELNRESQDELISRSEHA